MKNLIVGLLMMTSVSAAFAVECSAVKKEVVSHEIVSTKAQLKEVTSYPNYTKFETDIDEAYFSIEVIGDTVRSMITIGPDYTTGNLSKGSFDADGNLKLSFVTPSKTYIVTCTQ